jgi:UDP-GlcNAc:undecaprenyl-phosphate GlcNAc-1-phosphate transferase
MMSLAILAVSALLLTLAITPPCRALCRWLEWVDRPGPRKLHREAIPRTGGIPIFFAYAATLASLRCIPLGKFSPLSRGAEIVWPILPGVLVVFSTGLLDDLVNLKPRAKVVGQVLAALLVCAGGIHIPGVGGAWWPVPLTVFWLVGCANAFNLIDGLDGLAAGIGICATAGALLSALVTGNAELVLVAAPLFGALLGFLPFNVSPASIFMGDSGSNTVGFLLGCLAIVWSQRPATLLGMSAPLVALSIPLCDTTLTIARRFLRGQRIFVADRGHIHHRLLSRGCTPRQAAYVLYAFAGLLACLSVLLTISTYSGPLVMAALCTVFWLAIHYLEYEEFDAARRVIFGGVIRDAVIADVSTRQLETSIKRAVSVEECWTALEQSGKSFGLSSAAMQIDGQRFAAQFTEAPRAGACWSLTIPLNGAGAITLEMPFRTERGPAPAGLLAAALALALPPKLEALGLATASGSAAIPVFFFKREGPRASNTGKPNALAWVLNWFGDFGQEPLAHARGSESGSIVCHNLPSRDRKGAVARDGFPQDRLSTPLAR